MNWFVWMLEIRREERPSWLRCHMTNRAPYRIREKLPKIPF